MTPPTASPDAQALAEARRHFDIAMALHDQHNLDGALAEFQRAYELAGRPGALFNVASTQQALHQYPAALRSFRSFLTLPGSTTPQRRDAQRAVSELEALVARVRVETVPAGAAFTVDGRAPELEAGVLVLGPGRHTVEATREGHRPAREELTVVSGQSRTVRLVLEVIPPVGPPIDPPVRPTVLPATLAITNAPSDATLLVNDERHGAQDPLSLAPGDYTLFVSAPGAHAWSDRVTLQEGRAHSVRVELAQRGMHPTAFFVSLGLTAAASIAGAALTGVTVPAAGAWEANSQNYERRLAALYESVARLQDNARLTPRHRVDAFYREEEWGLLDNERARLANLDIAAVTMAALGLAGVVVTSVLAARTEFSPRRSTGVLRISPVAVPALTPGGGVGVSISTPF